MNEQKLYMRPKEVEQVFSIKQSTLSKQRDGKIRSAVHSCWT
jgi:hypothetical protein